MTLFCSWVDSLPCTIKVHPILLPGRGSRINDPIPEKLKDVISYIMTDIKSYLDRPFAIFGYSMGALIGFELCRALQVLNVRKPNHLFVASYPSPTRSRSKPWLHEQSDVALLAKIQRLGGAVLENRELMKVILPVLRSDLRFCETYEYSEGRALDCPISVFCGRSDPLVVVDQLSEWGQLTKQKCIVDLFYGGHFFIETAEKRVLEIISNRLLS